LLIKTKKLKKQKKNPKQISFKNHRRNVRHRDDKIYKNQASSKKPTIRNCLELTKNQTQFIQKVCNNPVPAAIFAAMVSPDEERVFITITIFPHQMH
jgi:hypothetical protein